MLFSYESTQIADHKIGDHLKFSRLKFEKNQAPLHAVPFRAPSANLISNEMVRHKSNFLDILLRKITK